MLQKTKNKYSGPRRRGSLTEQKRPCNEVDSSDFSITKHAHHEHHYAKSESSIIEPIVDLSIELNSRSTSSDATACKEITQEIAVNCSSPKISIKIGSHQRSPYIIRLKKDSILKLAEEVLTVKPIEVAKPLPANPLPVLAIDYKPSTGAKKKAKSELNFLNQKNHSISSSPLVFSNIPKAIFGWFFDFILSIPLALLFIFQVVLLVIEKFFSAIAWTGRSIFKLLFFIVQQILSIAVSLGRAIFILPIKLITLVFLLIFRVFSDLGLAIVNFWNNSIAFFKIIARSFIHPPRFFWRRLTSFVAITVLFFGVFKFTIDTPRQLRQARGRVLGAATEGVSALRNFGKSIQSGEMAAAESSWQKANLKFSEASQSLDSVNILARSLIKLTPSGQSGVKLLSVVQELTLASDFFQKSMAPLLAENIDAISLIRAFSDSIISAQPHIVAAQRDLKQVDISVVPETYREQFSTAADVLPKIQEAIVDFSKLSSSLTSALGDDGVKHYAVLFQNNNELRPSGGFIGSLALVDIERGRVTNISIPGGGSYDFNGQLTKHVYAPKPLWLINPHWQVQDSNWYPDWPTSAEKLMWFLENSGYSSLDGVIAFQATTLQELLAILGPVDFPEQNITLTKENVLQEIQAEVELRYDKTKNKPKEYIAQLAPKILDAILASHGSEWAQILDFLDNEIADKNILLYFRDKELNQELQDRGWQSRILPNDSDYLSVINANIGGGKTDGVIAEEWRQNINISNDGTAIAELTITRRHNGEKDDIFAGVDNIDFVRVYVPMGSELISASGFTPPLPSSFEQPEPYYSPDEELTAIEGKVMIDESSGTRINNEFGKTVFGNWLRVSVGNKVTAKIKYRLPFKITPPDGWSKDRGGYSFLMQKQAGARPAKFIITLNYPQSWQISWQKQAGENQLLPMGPGILELSGALSRDTGFGVLFGKSK